MNLNASKMGLTENAFLCINHIWKPTIKSNSGQSEDFKCKKKKRGKQKRLGAAKKHNNKTNIQ